MIEPRKLGDRRKIALRVRTQRIYRRHAATFLNPSTVPASFVDSMANQRKQGVRNAELEILDDLHVVRRDDDAEVAEPGHLAPIEPSQPDVESIGFTRDLKS